MSIGEAGRKGDTVRSDCFVRIELKDKGGVNLAVNSKVEAMYGDRIRALILEGLKQLGIGNCDCSVEDHGALDFVLAARLEAAAKRAGVPKEKEFLLPEHPSTLAIAGLRTLLLQAKRNPYYDQDMINARIAELQKAKNEANLKPTTRERLRRSRLYLPGNEPKFFLNASLHKPDGVILDLEDSVSPLEKDAARLLVRNALRAVDFGDCERMVRINQGALGVEDLEAIVPQNVHVILIPKVETGEHVRSVDSLAEKIRKEKGLEKPCFLMPIIESALGCFEATYIASATSNVVALTIGLEDYTADIGAERTQEGTESFWARSVVVNAARAAQVTPIDSVFSDVTDMDGLMKSCLESKAMGFEGKGCIHPRQIAVVHEGFAPKEKEIEKAKKIVLAFEDAQKKGLGVVSLGSKMIDPPVVKRAVRTVDLALKLGRINENWREEVKDGKK